VPPEGNHGKDGQCGYISWHRDKPPADGWPLPNYRMIKAFLNVRDVPENGGETAVVPGSFRLQSGPAQTLDGNFTASTADRAAGGLSGQLSHAAMPNHVGFSVPAGWVGLFDSSSWHTSMPNTSGSERQTCTFSYRSSECYSPHSRLPTWGGARAGLSEEQLRAAAERGCVLRALKSPEAWLCQRVIMPHLAVTSTSHAGKLRAGHCRSQGAECWVCQTYFRGKQMKAPMARGSILWAECVQRRKKGEAGMAKKWLPPQLSLSHNTVCIRTVDGVSLSPAPAVALQRACSPTQTKGE
jgi:hypothetical protein